MAIELFRHNQEAYESAVAMLEAVGKTCVIHPTGTGKSFIGFKLCEDNPDKTVLWLSPSEYIFKTQLENLAKVSNDYVPENIVFMTYAKLSMMSDEDIKQLSFDYVVLDEFHRGGSEIWGAHLNTLLSEFPDVPVLGLSATAIRYLDNQRNMADELFDGNIASEMTLGEAIVRGILNPPKYILSIYSYQKDLEKYENRVRRAKSKAVRDKAGEYLEHLRRSLENADGLDKIFEKHMTDKHGKYIVFTPNYDTMQEYISQCVNWFWRIDREPQIYSVYSDDSAAEEEFQKFKSDCSDHLKLLFCIDALNEGVHIEDISGVILMRPTVSPIIYKQQIGRALSASKSKEPIIFDIVNNIENLYSIDSIKEEMQVAIAYYRSFGFGDNIKNEAFELIDKVADCRSLFDNLEETLTASWDLMYEKCVEYHKTHGNLDVPTKYITPDGYTIGTWLQTNRRVYKGAVNGILTSERIEKLNKLGMRWDSAADVSWERYYNACVAYKEKFGNLSPVVGYTDENGIQLGRWIANIRTNRRSGTKTAYLTEERIAALDALGMVWKIHDFTFERFYNSAVNYLKTFGDLNVPVGYVDSDSLRLGSWLDRMRNYRKTNNPILTEDEIERLDSIGMIWDKKFEHRWNTGYEELKKYKKENNSLAVPLAYVSSTGFKLGQWYNDQLYAYGRNLPKI
ncbi:MAG: Helicase associated domain protein, partial [Ruminiclostridium sp.]|nr:Helicase associated domain protein [Ruminiclostridium sp.]